MAFHVVNDSTNQLRKNGFCTAFALTFKQFCEISSIHGIRYFHDPGSHSTGKIIWIILVLASLFCANAMVYIFYKDFSSNPIRMIIDSDHVPLPNLVFPAVTLCPPTVYNYPAVKKIFQNLTLPANMSVDDALSYLDQLNAVVHKIEGYDVDKLETIQRIVDLNNLTTAAFISLVRWNCSDMMYRCRFQLKIFNCSDIFVSFRSYQGYCCSFNVNEIGSDSLRYHSHNFGPDGGLSVIIKDIKNDQHGLDMFTSSEVDLIIHQNDEYPHRSMLSHSVPNNLEVFAAIRPTEIVCTAEFKALPVKDRQCLLPFEHNMRLFRLYSSDNCEYECNVMSTVDTCGCMPYTMASTAEQACDFTKLPCLYDGFRNFEKADNGSGSIQTDSACYCPNSCEGIEYDVQITHAILQTTIESSDPLYLGIQENFTVLHVYMASQVYRRLKRDTPSDILILIGNLGSSYSLFLGMSMISLLEIAYFFTLVLWRNYTRQ